MLLGGPEDVLGARLVATQSHSVSYEPAVFSSFQTQLEGDLPAALEEEGHDESMREAYTSSIHEAVASSCGFKGQRQQSNGAKRGAVARGSPLRIASTSW